MGGAAGGEARRSGLQPSHAFHQQGGTQPRHPRPLPAGKTGDETKDLGYRTITNYAQQTRVINNRSFFLNGNQWTDAQVQQMKSPTHVHIAFNSDAYFDLITKYPDAAQYLSLGNNITLELGGTVYGDIVEEFAGTDCRNDGGISGDGPDEAGKGRDCQAWGVFGTRFWARWPRARWPNDIDPMAIFLDYPRFTFSVKMGNLLEKNRVFGG